MKYDKLINELQLVFMDIKKLKQQLSKNTSNDNKDSKEVLTEI